MPTGYNLDNLTDEQLIQLAGSLGIDTQEFSMNPPAGVLNFNEPVPGVSQALPSALTGALPNLAGFNEPVSPSFTVSPEIRDLVAREYQAQRGLGTENIRREAQAAAGARGLSLVDTPISDPYMRALALLESQLGGQEASSVLGLGERYNQFREGALQNRFGLLEGTVRGARGQNLAESQFAENALQGRTTLLENMRKAARAQSFLESQASKEFDMNVADFQNRLRQQAFQNRLQLATTLGNLGTTMSGQRTGVPTSSTTTAPPDVLGGFGLVGRGIQASTLTPTNSNFQNLLMASALGLNQSMFG